jgi:RNA polymerase sigma-70 factor (ECF subfamily)
MLIDTHFPAQAQNAVLRNLVVNQHLLDGRREFLGYLRRRLGNLDEAEDALQDFSLKVIRSARSVDQDDKIDAWLGKTLRHTLIDHYRRRAVRQRTETAYAQEMSIADQAPQSEVEFGHCRCLYAALPRLRPDYAEILRRADLKEEPRARIAADLGLTINTLNVRLHRARHALRQEIERSCAACGNGNFHGCACG